LDMCQDAWQIAHLSQSRMVQSLPAQLDREVAPMQWQCSMSSMTPENDVRLRSVKTSPSYGVDLISPL
jgi:hypothetical protein